MGSGEFTAQPGHSQVLLDLLLACLCLGFCSNWGKKVQCGDEEGNVGRGAWYTGLVIILNHFSNAYSFFLLVCPVL